MVKRKVAWTPEAKIEFFEILNFYYHRNGNANYSRKLNDKIKHAISRLINAPYLGKKLITKGFE